MKNRHFKDSFKNAIKGLIRAFKEERNFRIELMIGVLVVILSIFLKITLLEWTIVVFCIILVLVSELFNSAMEHLVDLFSPEFHVLAMKAKDISAGAVLVISIGSAIIGCLVFLPKIIRLI